MPDFNEIMKQAQAMQEKLQAAQEKLAQTSVEGTAGGGMVSLTLQGAGELKALKIDPSLLKSEEAEILTDLIVAAHADARRKLEANQAQAMREAAGPLAGFPGLKF
jgi:hypothetical protein